MEPPVVLIVIEAELHRASTRLHHLTHDVHALTSGPDVNIDGVFRYKKKFQSHTKFYDAAAAGTLPAFSWISPSQQGSDHPCVSDKALL